MSELKTTLPGTWQTLLADELVQPYFEALERFVARERAEHTVYPPPADVFNAFAATPFEKVKVLLLGQDPYHGANQAHGLAFSVRPGVRVPPSLVNMHKELQTDLGLTPPGHGSLEAWTEQGVMLLNAVLTVREGEPGSHAKQGWETFTDAVIRRLNARAEPLVFLFWGAYAQKKQKLVTEARHRVVANAHPSPLSAKKFWGSKPYSTVNAQLAQLGLAPINWRVPPLAT